MTVVSTTGGDVRGREYIGISSFKGIPYAAPISGAARWQAPAPPESWEGVRDATRYGSICPQEPPPNALLAGRAGKLFIDSLWTKQTQADDCLNLNVWTPTTDPTAKLPVMFWVHGGAFTTGSGSEPIYDGTNLARRDVVVVTINYRLGMMGSFVAPGMYDDDFCVPNRGFLDQTAALRWVQDNIAAFGGDPDNVTIFGESAGGQSICVLLASPATKGLFRRAIAQSGTPDLGSALADHRHFAEDFLAANDIPTGDRDALSAMTGKDTVKAAKASRKLLAKGTEERYGTIMSGFNVGCVYGDDFMPLSILDSLENGVGGDVDLMIGTVREDGRLFPLVLPGPESAAGALSMKMLSGLMTPKNEPKTMFERYEAVMSGASKNTVRGQVLTDVLFRRGTVRAAERHAGSTHLYQFDWASPVLKGAIGAMHAIEIPFVNGNLEVAAPLLGDLDDIRELAEMTMATWVNFARSGTPSAPGLPDWPEFDTETRATMSFDTTTELRHDVDPELRSLW